MFSKIASIIDKGMDIFQDHFPGDLSPDQKAKLQQATQALKATLQQNLAKEVSNRHKVDMKSDSWLSKNIRPLSLIFFLGMFTAGSLFNDYFNMSESFVSMLQSSLMLILGFYFGGRTIEKMGMMFMDNKKKKDDDFNQSFLEKMKK